MKKKKAIVLILFVTLVCFSLYNFINYFRIGKQKINVSTSSQIYSNSSIEAIINVTDKKNNSIKSDVKIELLDSEGKKVKGIKQNLKKEEDQKVQVSIPLSNEIDTGKYELKLTSTSKHGLFKDVLKFPVNIINGNELKTIISLDKGIYKPGDKVNFRALMISKRDNVPADTLVNLTIYDGKDNKVYSNEVETSEYGIVSGNFKLANEVNSGTYRLVVSTDSIETTKTFTVNPYIIPQFEVNVTTDKENYTVGENAIINVQAKYFFGEAVSNATVKGTINGNPFEGITNLDGIYETTYNVTQNGKVDINVNVTDSSKYLIESKKTFFVSSDLFEIEVLPEYGDIIENIDNEVYIFTKTVNGDALKTNSTITIGNISRQVITDENGVGSFTLSSDDTRNLYNAILKIKAEDSEGRQVTKNETINVEKNRNIIIDTAKVRYNVGEDIDLKLISNLDVTSKEVYFYKGNELLKVISSENDEISVNLEDVSGLIDIYVRERRKTSPYYMARIDQDNNYKKTIFIKPDKKLNIAITTNSEEYLPGDKMNIEFKTTDESNNQIDSSLLVSILDEAILNLSENDLSIDNIKIALEDIELSSGITAADLYVNVMDDSSEGLLKALLLKQSYTSPNICRQSNFSESYKHEYLEKAVYSLIAVIIVIAIYAFSKLAKNESKAGKVAKFIAHVANLFAIFIVFGIVLFEPIYDLYYSILDSYKLINIFTLLTNVVLTFVLYTLILYKQRDYIFGMIVNLAVIPVTYILVIYLFATFIGVQELIILVFLTLLVIWAFLVNRSRQHKLGNKEQFFKYTLTQLFKGLIVFLAIALLNEIFFSPIVLWIVLVGYVFIDKYVFGKTKIKMQGNQINLNVTGNELIVAGIGLLFIVVLFVGIATIANNFAGSKINDSMASLPMNDAILSEDSLDSENSTSLRGPDRNNGISFSGTSKSESIQEPFLSFDEKNQVAEEETPEMVEIEKTEEVVENVRNVFLESLAFIPELVTENGSANLELNISDNITTWNIQTVGNSKNGKLGYSSKTFKVFKDFFVDFTLPTNSVVTDKVEIPVTLYNYTEQNMNIEIDVKPNEWSNIGEYEKTVNVPANSTYMVYVPIEITKSGNNIFRVETKSGNISDIVEKNIQVTENGLKVEKIVSSGTMQKNISQDIIYSDNAIEGSKKIKVKIYPSSIAQIIENMDSILSLPNGCFEQTSSSLYPDILALKYLKNNNLDNQEIKTRALEYISSGYQRLLTYEVDGTKGGYSLYGESPAEPVITAFGLMEMNELSDVYEVDKNVIENMKDYLFKVQNVNGSFDYKSTYIGGSESTDELAMNAYIIWGLSEVCPEDSRIEKSVEYLSKNIDKAEDTYTLALMANVFINTEKENESRKIVNKLMEKVISDGDSSYVESNLRDYYGCWNLYQNIQSTALTSIALTKNNTNEKTNQGLINYLIKSKSPNGTWGTTQSTVLALKAINDYGTNSDISNQTIVVKVNDKVQSIDIDKNSLGVYEVLFEDIPSENKVSIEMKKGKITYEIIKDFYKDHEYAEFEEAAKSNNKLMIEQTITQTAKVNEEIFQKIHVINKSNEDIFNGLVQINIPQGCSVNEESLMMLKHSELIEKYEYNYGRINLYLRDLKNNAEMDLEVKYRALYPETITGGAVRIYDYYNPELEAIAMPEQISINEI